MCVCCQPSGCVHTISRQNSKDSVPERFIQTKACRNQTDAETLCADLSAGEKERGDFVIAQLKKCVNSVIEVQRGS